MYLGLSPFAVVVTNRILTLLVGDPYKPSFATVIGKGTNPKDELTSCCMTRCLGIDTQNSCFLKWKSPCTKPIIFFNMGVSKNRGTPKWMVKIMEIPLKMDDLGGKPTIFGNIHIHPCNQNFQQVLLEVGNENTKHMDLAAKGCDEMSCSQLRIGKSPPLSVETRDLAGLSLAFEYLLDIFIYTYILYPSFNSESSLIWGWYNSIS